MSEGVTPHGGLDQDIIEAHPAAGTGRPGDMAIGVIIGRTSEYFDFFVYAIASVLVFPRVMFPFEDALTGTLFSFAIFSLAFVARPIGTVIFTAIDRTHGRSAKLIFALLGLGTSTVAVAFLPSYNQIGWFSPLLLTLCRIGQGVALGGTWDGLPSLLAINAPANRRGWYAMLPQLGAPLGLIVASGLFSYFIANLPAADFYEWGWRYPFMVAFSINVVALFARLRIVVTPEFSGLFKAQSLEASPVGETIKAERKNIILGTLAPLVAFVLFHMVTVFPLSWLFVFTKQPPARVLIIELVSALVGVAAMLASGVLADKFGRRRLLGAVAIAIGFYSGFAPQLLAGGDWGEAAYMALGFVLLGLSFGQASGTLASNFAVARRYTSSAIVADLSWLFGAGFAPLVALWMSSKLGLIGSGVYLASGAVCTLLALGLNLQSANAEL